MTLDEARAHIGDGVVCRPPAPGLRAEEGVITSVGRLWVFVRYGYEGTSSATNPADLELLAN